MNSRPTQACISNCVPVLEPVCCVLLFWNSLWHYVTNLYSRPLLLSRVYLIRSYFKPLPRVFLFHILRTQVHRAKAGSIVRCLKDNKRMTQFFQLNLIRLPRCSFSVLAGVLWVLYRVFWKHNSEIEDVCNNNSRQQGKFLSNTTQKSTHFSDILLTKVRSYPWQPVFLGYICIARRSFTLFGMNIVAKTFKYPVGKSNLHLYKAS